MMLGKGPSCFGWWEVVLKTLRRARDAEREPASFRKSRLFNLLILPLRQIPKEHHKQRQQT